MPRPAVRSFLTAAAALIAVWLAGKYLLPLLLPFLLGAVLAALAEPIVRRLSAHVPRGAAAGIGVAAVLLLLFGALALLGSLAVRELGVLAGAVPQMAEAVRSGAQSLEDFLLALAGNAPDGLNSLLTRTVLRLFGSGSTLLDHLLSRLPGVLGGVLGQLPNGAVGVGTGLISAFLISARLPRLRGWMQHRLPEEWKSRVVPLLHHVRSAAGAYLKAQAKLLLVTFGIVLVGLLLLQIPYAPLCAAGIAVVDAIPILGTGTVLLPWALVSLLQGSPARAIGLLGIYAASALTRSMLEPRLVGRQLGLDPLVTLVCLYIGYRLWGFAGLLIAPVLGVTVTEFARESRA